MAPKNVIFSVPASIFLALKWGGGGVEAPRFDFNATLKSILNKVSLSKNLGNSNCGFLTIPYYSYQKYMQSPTNFRKSSITYLNSQ